MVIPYGYTTLAYLVYPKEGPREYTWPMKIFGWPKPMTSSDPWRTRLEQIEYSKGANPKFETDSICARDLPKLYIKARRAQRGGRILFHRIHTSTPDCIFAPCNFW